MPRLARSCELSTNPVGGHRPGAIQGTTPRRSAGSTPFSRHPQPPLTVHSRGLTSGYHACQLSAHTRPAERAAGLPAGRDLSGSWRPGLPGWRSQARAQSALGRLDKLHTELSDAAFAFSPPAPLARSGGGIFRVGAAESVRLLIRRNPLINERHLNFKGATLIEILSTGITWPTRRNCPGATRTRQHRLCRAVFGVFKGVFRGEGRSKAGNGQGRA